jgi:hypothetical protein
MGQDQERTTCPACGGAGGGPMGRAGSAWDDEEYVCIRCEGEGFVWARTDVASQRPGLVKAAAVTADEIAREHKATGSG